MFFGSTGLKQHRLNAGGMLCTIALTVCHASAPQSASAKPSPIVNRSISSSLVPVSPTQIAASTESSQQQAVQVIRDYYTAIARRDYKKAYLTWEENGSASQQSFEQFKQGFANTTSTAVAVGKPSQLDGAAGSIYIKIPVTVSAMTANGTRQRFRGSYVLRRVNNVPGSTLEQHRWHFYSSNLTQVN